ncbi:hypothetical protein [Streptomyces erythrochromogenes]|uniref:hypothetical protein n=1 Tax=Streptomyces erythrochromogenes TaxID=285574 RepID=UPI002258677A|nr:hypothetical protein [Streptomyces erythrochromogenes]MCX5587583.1 hypothetical protein [Streptomyces erythrochromogenes]
MTPAERRRALAFSAIGSALNAHKLWLPDNIRTDVADAVLEAIAYELEHCTHSAATHQQHHDQPVDACPWCSEPATTDLPTGSLL